MTVSSTAQALYCDPYGDETACTYASGLMSGPFEERMADGWVSCVGEMDCAVRVRADLLRLRLCLLLLLLQLLLLPLVPLVLVLVLLVLLRLVLVLVLLLSCCCRCC